jgi:galactose-1-phosphate uridylyltransferase
MASISFASSEDTLEVLNPLRGFERETQRVQVRKDPLLGHTSVYNPFLQDKAKAFFGEVDRELIHKLAADTAPNCIFCPAKISGTAKYPESLLPQGRIQVGEAVLFPNLFALGKHHAVVAVARAHFLELREFTPEILADAFRAMQQLAVAIYRHDDSAVHLSVNANYLFPAGASLVHPHFQMLITREPYTHQARLADACRSYFVSHGTAYHRDLIETERTARERYIGRTGAWHWLSAYAPLGSNEILAVHEESGDFAGLGDVALRDLSRGLAATLRAYEELGFLSFNFTLFARREPRSPDGFNCLLRCMTRQNPYPNYRTDDYFLQKCLQTELILMPPEELAGRVAAQLPD